MNKTAELYKKEKLTNNILKKLLVEKEMYQKYAEGFEKELASLPEGFLTRKVINGNAYFYQLIKDEFGITKQKYLSSKGNDFVSAIKRRHFVEKSLTLLNNDIKALDTFLSRFNPYDAAEVTLTLPEVYQNLPKKDSYDKHENFSELSWQDIPYKKNEAYPEGLINYSADGVKVRSKSEALIASILEKKNIPFRYEAELRLGDHLYYPDFTILKPSDGEIIYWEHFGMNNNVQYSISMEQKLILYTRYSIIPWENLIITFDSKNGSIDTQIIQRILQAFIL